MSNELASQGLAPKQQALSKYDSICSSSHSVIGNVIGLSAVAGSGYYCNTSSDTPRTFTCNHHGLNPDKVSSIGQTLINSQDPLTWDKKAYLLVLGVNECNPKIVNDYLVNVVDTLDKARGVSIGEIGYRHVLKYNKLMKTMNIHVDNLSSAPIQQPGSIEITTDIITKALVNSLDQVCEIFNETKMKFRVAGWERDARNFVCAGVDMAQKDEVVNDVLKRNAFLYIQKHRREDKLLVFAPTDILHRLFITASAINKRFPFSNQTNIFECFELNSNIPSQQNKIFCGCEYYLHTLIGNDVETLHEAARDFSINASHQQSAVTKRDWSDVIMSMTEKSAKVLEHFKFEGLEIGSDCTPCVQLESLIKEIILSQVSELTVFEPCKTEIQVIFAACGMNKTEIDDLVQNWINMVRNEALDVKISYDVISPWRHMARHNKICYDRKLRGIKENKILPHILAFLPIFVLVVGSCIYHKEDLKMISDVNTSDHRIEQVTDNVSLFTDIAYVKFLLCYIPSMLRTIIFDHPSTQTFLATVGGNKGVMTNKLKFQITKEMVFFIFQVVHEFGMNPKCMLFSADNKNPHKLRSDVEKSCGFDPLIIKSIFYVIQLLRKVLKNKTLPNEHVFDLEYVVKSHTKRRNGPAYKTYCEKTRFEAVKKVIKHTLENTLAGNRSDIKLITIEEDEDDSGDSKRIRKRDTIEKKPKKRLKKVVTFGVDHDKGVTPMSKKEDKITSGKKISRDTTDEQVSKVGIKRKSVPKISQKNELEASVDSSNDEDKKVLHAPDGNALSTISDKEGSNHMSMPITCSHSGVGDGFFNTSHSLDIGYMDTLHDDLETLKQVWHGENNGVLCNTNIQTTPEENQRFPQAKSNLVQQSMNDFICSNETVLSQYYEYIGKKEQYAPLRRMKFLKDVGVKKFATEHEEQLATNEQECVLPIVKCSASTVIEKNSLSSSSQTGNNFVNIAYKGSNLKKDSVISSAGIENNSSVSSTNSNNTESNNNLPIKEDLKLNKSALIDEPLTSGPMNDSEGKDNGEYHSKTLPDMKDNKTEMTGVTSSKIIVNKQCVDSDSSCKKGSNVAITPADGANKTIKNDEFNSSAENHSKIDSTNSNELKNCSNLHSNKHLNLKKSAVSDTLVTTELKLVSEDKDKEICNTEQNVKMTAAANATSTTDEIISSKKPKTRKEIIVKIENNRNNDDRNLRSGVCNFDPKFVKENILELKLRKGQQLGMTTRRAAAYKPFLFKKYTVQESKALKNLLECGKKKDEELVLTIKGDRLTKHDIFTLQNGEWIVCHVINDYFELLEEHFPMNFYFSKNFFDKLVRFDGVYSYNEVKRWKIASRGDIFKKKKIFFPRCACGHWDLIVVIPDKKMLVHLCSMKRGGHDFIRDILKYLKDEWAATNSKYKRGEWTDFKAYPMIDHIPSQKNCESI